MVSIVGHSSLTWLALFTVATSFKGYVVAACFCPLVIFPSVKLNQIKLCQGTCEVLCSPSLSGWSWDYLLALLGADFSRAVFYPAHGPQHILVDIVDSPTVVSISSWASTRLLRWDGDSEGQWALPTTHRQWMQKEDSADFFQGFSSTFFFF